MLNQYPKLLRRRPALQGINNAFWDTLANHVRGKELSEFIKLEVT